MAYASLPKLVPIDTSNMCPTNVAKPTLSEVLQSDPVKRLFNQPNLIIKTVPLNSLTDSNKDIFGNKKNGMNTLLLNNIRQPEISIVPVRMTDEEREDANLLPSKIEDKKSEIALVPVRKKVCGHYEPCENIICDVTVQQYVDHDGVSPMLATNIEEEEINAPVAKHCKNEHCDALSIDHNRCRRALIKLHRCDKSCTCDICGTTLKGWKYVYRIHHKNCRPKNEYRHNNVDRMHLLRERMRERELQILEIAKTKRNDYSDPTRAMEILRKNEELIIIPKTAPSQQPIITITSVPTQSISSNSPNAQPVDANSRGSNFMNIGSVSVLTRSNAMPDSALRPEESKMQPMSQMRFPNLQQNSYNEYVMCTVTTAPVPAPAPASVVSSQKQYIHLTTPSQITTTMTTTTTISTTTTTTTTAATTTVQSLTINNWVVSPSHVLTTTPIQPKFLTARVLPITNLITAPSLLHRTQGIPKFCIMTDNMLKPVTIPNPQSIQQPVAAAAAANISAAQQRVIIKVPIQHNPQKRYMPKKIPKKKNFFCVYCSKHFSTDWYFKMHVARHEEKPFSCSFCDKSFSNKFDMKKHIANQHTACNKCDYVSNSPISFSNHIKTHATSCSDEANNLKKLKKEDETNCTTAVHDLNGEYTKVKCEDPPSNMNNDKDKVCTNGEVIQDNAESLESARIKEHDDKKLSAINRNNSQKTNGFSFVSIKEEIDSENFEKEEVIISR